MKYFRWVWIQATIRMICVAGLACVFALPAHAVGLLRDADIEYALSQLSKPILTAAGLSSGQVRILVVDDMDLNAFVIDSRHIFIHAGLLLRTRSPEQVQAVIAHEAAHIANGHFARRIQNLQTARSAAAFGTALAIAAAATTGQGEAATGLAIGIGSAAQRQFLAHSRAEESSADSAALGYMVRAGVDPRGMKDMLDIFVGQENLTRGRQDPYVRSHPISRDRARNVDAISSAQPKQAPTNDARYWHGRAIGKLSAFLRSPQWTLRRAADSVSKDIEYMRRAVALSRQGDIDGAMVQMDRALQLRPKDPFLMDLQAELLMRDRQFSRAATTYARATKYAPNDPLILAGMGRAHMAAGQPKAAVTALSKARDRDFRSARLLRDLAQAYASIDNLPMASLLTAERYALQGKLEDAKIHATRAAGQLPRGGPSWQRAQDILSFR